MTINEVAPTSLSPELHEFAQLLPRTITAAARASSDAVLSSVEATTLRDRPTLHIGWTEPASGVHHDVYARSDSGQIELVTTDGAYGVPGVWSERTGPGALAGLAPADAAGQRRAAALEDALRAELPLAAPRLFTGHSAGLSAEEVAELREASAVGELEYSIGTGEQIGVQHGSDQQYGRAGDRNDRQDSALTRRR